MLLLPAVLARLLQAAGTASISVRRRGVC